MTKHVVFAQCYDSKGNVISTAFNNYEKSHPLQKRFAIQAGQPYKEFLHAEILAIIRAKQPIYKISVTRKNSKGELRLAAPCPVCQLAIKEAGIKVVEYSV